MTRSAYWCILVLGVLAAPMPGSARDARANDPVFDSCMSRHKHDLAACNSGCGLILKACYDEAFEKYQDEIQEIVDASTTSVCKEKLTVLQRQADGFRGNAEAAVDSGSWRQFDIRLISVKSQLDLLKVVKDGCVSRD